LSNFSTDANNKSDSLQTEVSVVEIECSVCLRKCDQKIGYIVVQCSSCDSHYKLDGHDVFRKQREYLGLTTAEIGHILGVSNDKIIDYETNGAPESALERTKELVIAQQNRAPS